MSELMAKTPQHQPFVTGITALRQNLGFTYQLIASTGDPIIIQRYKSQEVIMVPLREWRF